MTRNEEKKFNFQFPKMPLSEDLTDAMFSRSFFHSELMLIGFPVPCVSFDFKLHTLFSVERNGKYSRIETSN